MLGWRGARGPNRDGSWPVGKRCAGGAKVAAKKKKKEKFSVTKAVKANARERVGQPKPSRLIEDKPAAVRRNVKHKEKLVDLLAGEPE
jgi:hypothetical protein